MNFHFFTFIRLVRNTKSVALQSSKRTVKSDWGLARHRLGGIMLPAPNSFVVVKIELGEEQLIKATTPLDLPCTHYISPMSMTQKWRVSEKGNWIWVASRYWDNLRGNRQWKSCRLGRFGGGGRETCWIRAGMILSTRFTEPVDCSKEKGRSYLATRWPTGVYFTWQIRKK